MGIPTDIRKDVTARVTIRLYDYLERRCAASNLTVREMAAKQLVQWCLSGCPPVDEPDRAHFTPELSMEAQEIGREIVGLYGWENLILPPTTAEQRAEVESKYQERRKQPQQRAHKQALWMGHEGNPTMLHRHYRGLATKAQADAFFALRPPAWRAQLGRIAAIISAYAAKKPRV